MAGISTIGVRLYNSAAGSSYTKVANLQEFPDIGADVESIDVTTLDDEFRHYIPGVKDTGGALTFVLLYETSEYNTLDGQKDSEYYWKLEFPSSTSGKVDTFTWKGYGVPGVIGHGVNEALTFNLNVLPTTDITFAKEQTPEA